MISMFGVTFGTVEVVAATPGFGPPDLDPLLLHADADSAAATSKANAIFPRRPGIRASVIAGLRAGEVGPATWRVTSGPQGQLAY
jgi:hypothetical protein